MPIIAAPSKSTGKLPALARTRSAISVKWWGLGGANQVLRRDNPQVRSEEPVVSF
jgi:hypothetical protein